MKPTHNLLADDLKTSLRIIEANIVQCDCPKHTAMNAISRFAALARAFVADAIEFHADVMTVELPNKLVEYPTAVTVHAGHWTGKMVLHRSPDVTAAIREYFHESSQSS